MITLWDVLKAAHIIFYGWWILTLGFQKLGQVGRLDRHPHRIFFESPNEYSLKFSRFNLPGKLKKPYPTGLNIDFKHLYFGIPLHLARYP